MLSSKPIPQAEGLANPKLLFVPSWLARWAAAEGLLLWGLRKEARDFVSKEKEGWALGDIANW